MPHDGTFIEVEVEPAFACNRRCDFCSRWALDLPDAYMSDETLYRVAESIGQYPSIRVSLAGRGEPLLHPKIMEYVAIIRSFSAACQISIITNGDKLTPKKVQEFWNAGGNILGVDNYGKGTFERREKLFAPFGPLKANVDANIWEKHPPSYRKIILMEDTAATTNKTRVLVGRVGTLPLENRLKYGIKDLVEPLKKKCVIPFRRPSVWWNGDVSMCCHAYAGDAVFTNIHEETLREAEKNPRLLAARQALYNRRRDLLPPCRRCDYVGGFYQGFLPKQEELTEERVKEIRRLWRVG